MTKLPITGEGLQCRAGCGRALGGLPHWEAAQRTGDQGRAGPDAAPAGTGQGRPWPGPLPTRAEGTRCPTAQPWPLPSARTPQVRHLDPCVLRGQAGRWLRCKGRGHAEATLATRPRGRPPLPLQAQVSCHCSPPTRPQGAPGWAGSRTGAEARNTSPPTRQGQPPPRTRQAPRALSPPWSPRSRRHPAPPARPTRMGTRGSLRDQHRAKTRHDARHDALHSGRSVNGGWMDRRTGWAAGGRAEDGPHAPGATPPRGSPCLCLRRDCHALPGCVRLPRDEARGGDAVSPQGPVPGAGGAHRATC